MALLKIRAHLRLVRTDGEDQVPDLEARPLRRARHQTRLPPPPLGPGRGADRGYVFVASYFSSADQSYEVCAASEYFRDTLVIN